MLGAAWAFVPLAREPSLSGNAAFFSCMRSERIESQKGWPARNRAADAKKRGMIPKIQAAPVKRWKGNGATRLAHANIP
jgi:hypothetical protein